MLLHLLVLSSTLCFRYCCTVVRNCPSTSPVESIHLPTSTMANPNPKPPKKRGRRFCNNNRKGRRNDRKTSGTFRIFRDESTAIDHPPPAAAAVVPEAVDEPTAPSKRKLTKADLTNSLAYSRRDLKRLRRENTKLVAKCHKQNEQLEKAKVIVNKKRSQPSDGLKAKDARHGRV